MILALHVFLDFPHEMGFVEALKTWLYTDEIGLVVDDIHFTSPISFGHSIFDLDPSRFARCARTARRGCQARYARFDSLLVHERLVRLEVSVEQVLSLSSEPVSRKDHYPLNMKGNGVKASTACHAQIVRKRIISKAIRGPIPAVPHPHAGMAP